MPEVVTVTETETIVIENNDLVDIVEIADPTPTIIEVGIAGPQGPQGPIGSGGTYRHVQLVASPVWTINHDLGAFLNITVVDSAGNEQVGDVRYIDANTIEVTFSGAFSGEAYIS